jgi:hypothetical protein
VKRVRERRLANSLRITLKRAARQCCTMVFLHGVVFSGHVRPQRLLKQGKTLIYFPPAQPSGFVFCVTAHPGAATTKQRRWSVETRHIRIGNETTYLLSRLQSRGLYSPSRYRHHRLLPLTCGTRPKRKSSPACPIDPLVWANRTSPIYIYTQRQKRYP